jgi:hypothetical protein
VCSIAAGIMGAVGSEEPEDSRFDPDAARRRWQGLNDETRRRIVKAARQGRPIPEGQTESVALGWAWVINGPPWARRRSRWHQYVWMAIDTGGDRASNEYALAGDPNYDLVPKVRRAARDVERVYLHARRPAAPYREPELGENLKPKWLRRALWGPGPKDAPLEISIA